MGMSRTDLEAYSRMGLSPALRNIGANTSDTLENHYVNGFISAYGVGGKQASFYIGSSLVMVSCQGQQQALELRLSSVCMCGLAGSGSALMRALSQSEMKQREGAQQSAYVTRIIHRRRQALDDDTYLAKESLRRFTQQEPGHVCPFAVMAKHLISSLLC